MLQIPGDLLTQLHAHLSAGYPNEACGLLLGLDVTALHGEPAFSVMRIEPVPNVADQSSVFENHIQGSLRNRYLINPDDYVRADRAAHAARLEIIGVFHSHPDHPAEPSQEDVRTAWLGLSYLIVSVNHGVAGDTRSWRLTKSLTAFEHETIQVDG